MLHLKEFTHSVFILKPIAARTYYLTKKHIRDLLDLGLKISLHVSGDWDYIVVNSIVCNIICGISHICL